MPRVRQKFGAHLSVAGGLHRAVAEARRLGCDCLQIFVKNQRQWNAPPLGDDAVRAFQAARRGSGVNPIVAHASYLLNLASPRPAARKRSIAALIDELQRCEGLAVSPLIVHPGSHLGAGEEAGVRLIAASLDHVHAATTGFKSRIALETTAGQGTTIGHDPRQMGAIIERTRDPHRVAVCLDTCHLFAAGYDWRKPGPYEALLESLAAHVGLKRIACIHANDSVGACGSRLDRHAPIGKGRIGRRGFARLLNDARLAAVPRILETPKGVDGRGQDLDVVNMRRLRKLVLD